ncbi:MAG TPA: hypothetical protein VGM60_14605 [Pseudonocardia sp.]|jgi:hypothetical protein|uniref:hypothetical protein n=1 Tax=Pseudonocardia sp. TaxID=60912 RepID=UPI002F3EE1D3
MSSWINLNAVGLILGLGLVFGAGLPALFAVGLRLLSPAGDRAAVAAGEPAGGGSEGINTGPGAIAGAGICFAVVVAAIAWGIYYIVAG